MMSMTLEERYEGAVEAKEKTGNDQMIMISINEYERYVKPNLFDPDPSTLTAYGYIRPSGSFKYE